MDRTADSRTSGAGGTFIKSLLFIGYSGKGARNIPFFTCNVFLNVIKYYLYYRLKRYKGMENGRKKEK